MHSHFRTQYFEALGHIKVVLHFLKLEILKAFQKQFLHIWSTAEVLGYDTSSPYDTKGWSLRSYGMTPHDTL